MNHLPNYTIKCAECGDTAIPTDASAYGSGCIIVMVCRACAMPNHAMFIYSLREMIYTYGELV